MIRYIFFLLFLPLISYSQSLYFPPLTGNNWDTISPASLGWCQPQLDSLIDYAGDRNSKALIILKDGKILVEEYYGTFTIDSSWYWASAGKSLTAVLTGIAQQESFLLIQDSTQAYLGPGWTAAPLAKEELITVRNQLTMTTGLDDGVADPDCTIDTCLQYLTDAGTRWAYHNAPYTLLDEVLQSATGVQLNTYFFQKLQLQTGMSGLYLPIGYNNVFLSKARSMARFGLLMLNNGNWNGNQILTDTGFLNQMINTSQNYNLSYGYLWWLNGKPSHMRPGLQIVFPGSIVPSAPPDMYAALGKDGQIINVVPSLNLVMVRMGEVPFAGLSAVPAIFNDTLWQKLNAAMCASTGLDEKIDMQLKVYPNPSFGEIKIDFPARQFSVFISDMAGRCIYRDEEYNENDIISVEHIAAGIYMVNVSSRGKSYQTRVAIH
jgi:CubicO group peptidase (beta-lactamase class C family)